MLGASRHTRSRKRKRFQKESSILESSQRPSEASMSSFLDGNSRREKALLEPLKTKYQLASISLFYQQNMKSTMRLLRILAPK